MKILKIIDGFVTNSSSVGTTIVAILKKGKNLGEMLEKIGLSSEFTARFDDKHGLNESILKWWIEDDYLDPNIYDLREEYEILQALIITYGYNGEVDDVDHSDFRKKFYDKIRLESLPLKLVGDDFILLHRLDSELEYEHEVKEDTKNKVWLFIEQLKNPEVKIEPRQPQSIEVKCLLEAKQREVIEEFERIIKTRIPVIKTINLASVEDFLSLGQKKRVWGTGNLIPDIEGFKAEGRDIVALGFRFKLNNQDPKTFPLSISQLSRLKILDLCFYNWKDTPEIFGNPNSIEILRFPSYCKFKTPPESLGKMSSLKRLSICDCKGRILPESIGNLKELEILQLKNNNCRRIIYKEKGKVPTVIPETIGHLKSLIILDLSYNNIDTIPDSLGELKSLQYIDLSCNHILKLPKNFGNLKKLKELYMYGNQLKFLPDSFGELELLKKCNLSGNNLTEFPNSIGNIIFLEEFRISKNPLNSLPASLSDLKNLKNLWIDPAQMNTFQKDPESLKVLNELKNNKVNIQLR
ncbi:MAG: hypothetical protein ACFFAF_12175 [Candidatus Hermodarchaeota archaeon]